MNSSQYKWIPVKVYKQWHSMREGCCEYEIISINPAILFHIFFYIPIYQIVEFHRNKGYQQWDVDVGEYEYLQSKLH